MNDSSLNQLNESNLDYSSESNQVDESRCVVDEQFVSKVGMTFKTLEETEKFYKDYSKLAVLNQSHPYCPDRAEMLKQHRELSIFVRRTFENKEARIRPIDHSIKNAFWADARSRIAYEYFEDVVSFDTTYNTNRYNLIFGSFVGMNHHSQSILLGCALMKNKDIQSFKWFFKYWLRCMGEKRHLAKIGMIFSRSMVLEAISSFQFITCNSSLIQFVKQYDNCLGSREQREREFDAADFHIVMLCATKSPIEAQFQHVYTHEKFRKVQAQFIRKVLNSTFNKFVVTYNTISREVKCQCLLFESKDILCHHSLKHKEETHTYQEQPRQASIGAEKQEIRRFGILVAQYLRICVRNEELSEILHQTFDNVIIEMQEYQAKSKVKSSLSHEDTTLSDVNDLQSPHVLKQEDVPRIDWDQI
ncbi:hypothetical protein Ahy_A02g006638 [Arachis hypogaea]|uniref:Protein FAR1-RELATED SEQUENCE n=1 Tax=Arachis hypogaea TaxID=3818 RepID=A0A445EA76_ARAHY|nr:hypothetical protein Ahy_A02g006638 [Arachis hypogaea]